MVNTIVLKATTTQSPVFPQEIFDSIIDHLHDNFTTLRSTRLVCRAFATAYRSILFYKIIIDADIFEALPALIRRAPEIPAFVRELHIVGAHDDLFSKSSHCSLLKEFKAIQRLRLRAFYTKSCSGWRFIPRELQEVFSALISLPTLTHLDLAGLGIIPIATFYSLNRGLQYLRLDNITLDPSLERPTEKSIRKENLPPIQLCHLGMAYIRRETIEFLLSKESPFDLTQLEGCAILGAGPAGSLVLQACQKSLQHYGHVFRTGPGPEAYTTTLQHDIAALNSLRSLTLFPVNSRTDGPLAIKLMLRVLEAVCHSSCALENITIIVWTESLRIPDGNLKEIWEAIDSALSIPTSLKKVTFIARVYSPTFDLDVLQASVKDTFPVIWRTGKAHLEIHNDGDLEDGLPVDSRILNALFL